MKGFLRSHVMMPLRYSGYSNRLRRQDDRGKNHQAINRLVFLGLLGQANKITESYASAYQVQMFGHLKTSSTQTVHASPRVSVHDVDQRVGGIHQKAPRYNLRVGALILRGYQLRGQVLRCFSYR